MIISCLSDIRRLDTRTLATRHFLIQGQALPLLAAETAKAALKVTEDAADVADRIFGIHTDPGVVSRAIDGLIDVLGDHAVYYRNIVVGAVRVNQRQAA